jgi:FAD/FMN-containing dehydrogenase
MNALYYRLHPEGTRHVHFQRWMYPLDSIRHWNRLYGNKGFRQFQCVVPLSQAPEAISEMLEIIAAARQRPFLAVLKNFGHLPSPGLMSFPMPGTTLALDFANRGAATVELLLRLHGITAAAGGRLYAAKDAGSPVESLASAFPNYARFKRMIDPGIGSLLAQRLRLLG